MPEYISREAANETINETAYEYEDDKALTALYHAADRLNDLPAADVVEVVRCYECACYNDDNLYHYCRKWRKTCPDDSELYCGWGKRKDGGQDDV